VLDHNNSAHNELLNKIKRRLRNETFTPDYLREIITLYPELIRALYLSFASYHYVLSSGSSSSTAPAVLKDHELQQLINKTVVNSDHENVMTACRMFNNSGI
jgi:glutamate dehydrogenase